MDTEAEVELLEAKKRRLIEQQDWTGIGYSKPPTIQLLPSRTKNPVGRRKKTTGFQRAIAQHRHGTDSIDGSPHASRPAMCKGNDKVCIRIGTDALSNTYSMQSSERTQSHAASDPMLFDQEDSTVGRAAELKGKMRPKPRREAEPCASWRDIADVHPRHGAPGTPFHLAQRHHRQRTDDEALAGLQVDQKRSTSSEHSELHARPQRCEINSNDDGSHSAEGVQITHHLEGIQRPFRLLFGRSSPSTYWRSNEVSRRDQSNKLEHSPHRLSANATEKGYLPHAQHNTGHIDISEASSSAGIVDDEQWRQYLSISNRPSSHSHTAVESESGILHVYPTARNNNEAVTNWSQHATQGDQTYISSSSTSASLPSLRHGIGELASLPPLVADHRGKRHQTMQQARGLDDDEKLWQAFVFDGDNSNSSDPPHAQPRIMKNTENGSSKYSPLSMAVSSLRNTPFRASPERASCMSDNVHGALLHAPQTTPRSFGAPMFDRSVDNMDSDRPRSRPSWHCALSEQPVTHASSDNIASGRIMAEYSRPSSNIRNIGTYSHEAGRARDFRSRQGANRGTWAGSSQPQLSSWSHNAVLASDTSDEDIHLVDATAVDETEH